jgi:hypothetical protein
MDISHQNIMTGSKILNINLLAASGDKPGEIELLWQPISNARAYVVQVTSNIRYEKYWKHADIVTRSKYTACGLKSKKLYHFRIAAITPSGQQQWSLPVSQTAS